MRLLILDNYDSFTYNLVHLVEKVSDMPYDIFKNDQISLNQIEAYDKILLSPGPGIPSEAGVMADLIQQYHTHKSIFGVCLGMQAIGECFSSPLKNLNTVFHGIATPISITQKDWLFQNCPDTFLVGRYHSWVIDEKRIHPSLEITAVDHYGMIMAVRHKQFNVRGVQFHPESILSEFGETIISNWLSHP